MTASFSNALKNKRSERKRPTRGKSRTWVCVEQNGEFWSINRVMQKYNQPTLAKQYFLSFERRGMREDRLVVFGPPTKRWIYALPEAVQNDAKKRYDVKATWYTQMIPSKTWRILYKRKRGDSFVLHSSCFKPLACHCSSPFFQWFLWYFYGFLNIPHQHLHKVDVLTHSPW